MTATHTPGPWEVDTFSSEHGPPAVFANDAPSGDKLIAECHGSQAAANARLIAAAPTMHKYLTVLAERGDDEAHAIIAEIAGS